MFYKMPQNIILKPTTKVTVKVESSCNVYVPIYNCEYKGEPNDDTSKLYKIKNITKISQL